MQFKVEKADGVRCVVESLALTYKGETEGADKEVAIRVEVPCSIDGPKGQKRWLGHTATFDKVQAFELICHLVKAYAMNWIEVDQYGYLRDIGTRWPESTLRVRKSEVEPKMFTVWEDGEEIYPPNGPLYGLDLMAAGLIAEVWPFFQNRREGVSFHKEAAEEAARESGGGDE